MRDALLVVSRLPLNCNYVEIIRKWDLEIQAEEMNGIRNWSHTLPRIFKIVIVLIISTLIFFTLLISENKRLFFGYFFQFSAKSD